MGSQATPDIPLDKALKQQQNEIDDHTIYRRMARLVSEDENRKILHEIAQEELSHYRFWEEITGRHLSPRRWVIHLYLLLARLLGVSFALKLLEKREEGAENFYLHLSKTHPQAKAIYEQERSHEKRLLGMLKDEKLLYAGAIVLGMNDALVELTGTLTGIAFAFDTPRVVGVTGVIMGIAASLSMAGSAYLEARENPAEGIRPITYALYTGISYILTTILLVAPFFLLTTSLTAVASMFTMAMWCIVTYNFYIAVARDESFGKRVGEMVLITFGVAGISFLIGYLARSWLGVDI